MSVIPVVCWARLKLMVQLGRTLAGRHSTSNAVKRPWPCMYLGRPVFSYNCPQEIKIDPLIIEILD
jgi:hypothetical protein